jgi:Tfp pilus assembly protein PilX
MHIHFPRQSREQGTVLLVTLFITVLFGMFLFSYLYLVRTQSATVARSQAWNSALALAEAGAEEALAQLNPGASQTNANLSGNGWGAPAGGFYGPVSRSLASGNYSVVFTTDTNPIIYSTGYVAVPSIPATLTRVVRVGTATTPMYTGAMVAKFGIDFNGNGVYTDSFDSTKTNLSTNGRYDPLKTSTNGNVGSMYGIVDVGNANVYGQVLLGPTATDSVSKNGFVTGGVRNDLNVDFTDVNLPAGSASWLNPPSVNTNIDGVTYQYYITGAGGDYLLGSFSGNIYVDSNTVVRLRIDGDATPNYVRVAGMGTNAGKLTIYMNGNKLKISGGVIVDGGLAASLSYLGTPNNAIVSFSGNSAFTGTIYAPEADFSFGGGGSSTYDFVGACVTRTVSVNGHYSFHFDESLAKGPTLGFTASSWKEL